MATYDLFVKAPPEMIREILGNKLRGTSPVFNGWHRVTVEFTDVDDLIQIADRLRKSGANVASSPFF